MPSLRFARVSSRLQRLYSGEVPAPFDETAERARASELMAWLRGHRLSQARATKLVQRSGCTSMDALALYLRFELPPLEYANKEAVAEEMREIFGVGMKRGFRMIEELGVRGAACESPAPLTPKTPASYLPRRRGGERCACIALCDPARPRRCL